MSILLEIATDSIGGALAAVAAGADRIELCAALSEGGLTPSAGLMHAASALKVPVFAMIRPRGGDFVYSPDEAKIMRRDIQMAKVSGMAGLVFGALRGDGELNSDLLAELLSASGDLPVTLHRAFDAVPDSGAALEQAVRLGFSRVLTSGQAADAASGAVRLGEMQRQAAGRIGVMPGGGIRAGNVAEILEASGACEVHAGARGATDAAVVAALRQELDRREAVALRVTA